MAIIRDPSRRFDWRIRNRLEESVGIGRAFDQAERKAKERGWDTIFVAIDWHDTICRSTYGDTATEFIGHAIDALRMMSGHPGIKMILYTSSYEDVVDEFRDLLEKEHGIEFDYFNENPEVESTEYGNFADKFYFDVLIDDKAGFDPENEWLTVWNRVRILSLKGKHES